MLDFGISVFYFCKIRQITDMAKDLFNRYIWLVDTIYRTKKITFEEINERWLRTAMSEGKEIPLRTFHNHRKAIEEMFDINIECNKHGGYYYYIENADDMENGGIRNWLLNTFAVNNLINESHNLKQRILLEDIPSGRQFLTQLIEAIRDNLVVKITYQSYRKNTPNTFEIEPYCVKIFKQRWYVVAHSPYYGRIMIYALDRIIDLRNTDKIFIYPVDFDPKNYFKFSFGIIVDEDYDVERIRIKVNHIQYPYFMALPLHHSQQEIEKTAEYIVFEYSLHPTFDFLQELLAHGNDLEVLSPPWLREEMTDITKKMYELYK